MWWKVAAILGSVLHAADDAGGGGGGDDKKAEDKSEDSKDGDDKPKDKDAKGSDDKPTGDAPGDKGGKGDIVLTPAQLKKRLDEAREREAKKIYEKQLEADKKFEDLAKQRGEELDAVKPQLEKATGDLETTRATLGELEAAIAADVAAEIKALGLDAATLELLEAMPVLDQRKWLTKHKAALQKKKPSGAPRSPDGGDAGLDKTKDAKKAAPPERL